MLALLLLLLHLTVPTALPFPASVALSVAFAPRVLAVSLLALPTLLVLILQGASLRRGSIAVLESLRAARAGYRARQEPGAGKEATELQQNRSLHRATPQHHRPGRLSEANARRQKTRAHRQVSRKSRELVGSQTRTCACARREGDRTGPRARWTCALGSPDPCHPHLCLLLPQQPRRLLLSGHHVDRCPIVAPYKPQRPLRSPRSRAGSTASAAYPLAANMEVTSADGSGCSGSAPLRPTSPDVRCCREGPPRALKRPACAPRPPFLLFRLSSPYGPERSHGEFAASLRARAPWDRAPPHDGRSWGIEQRLCCRMGRSGPCGEAPGDRSLSRSTVPSLSRPDGWRRRLFER